MTSLPPPLPPTLEQPATRPDTTLGRRPATPAGVLLRVFGGLLVFGFLGFGT